MILEIAEITVKEGTQTDFEAALRQAFPLLMQTEGYIAHEVQHSIEEPTRYVLLIQWESVDAHEVNFRQGPNFASWRGHIGPHFDGTPRVQHYERIDAE